jgi:hypothetical protein
MTNIQLMALFRRREGISPWSTRMYSVTSRMPSCCNASSKFNTKTLYIWTADPYSLLAHSIIIHYVLISCCCAKLDFHSDYLCMCSDIRSQGKAVYVILGAVHSRICTICTYFPGHVHIKIFLWSKYFGVYPLLGMAIFGYVHIF